MRCPDVSSDVFPVHKGHLHIMPGRSSPLTKPVRCTPGPVTRVNVLTITSEGMVVKIIFLKKLLFWPVREKL